MTISSDVENRSGSELDWHLFLAFPFLHLFIYISTRIVHPAGSDIESKYVGDDSKAKKHKDVRSAPRRAWNGREALDGGEVGG